MPRGKARSATTTMPPATTTARGRRARAVLTPAPVAVSTRRQRHHEPVAPLRRVSSRLRDLTSSATAATAPEPAWTMKTVGTTTTGGGETAVDSPMTDAEIIAALPHHDVLDPETTAMLVTLRRATLAATHARPQSFVLPFTPDDIKTIGQRKLVRQPPPFGRITKSIYLSQTLPVADLPVHKCNCFAENRASGLSSTRRGPAATGSDRVTPTGKAADDRKRRGRPPNNLKKIAMAAEAAPQPPTVYCGENCHNRMLFISCSKDTCSAPTPEQCSNRAIKRRETKPVRVEYIPGPGFGLIAEEIIEAGEFIVEYVGEVIDDKECERRLIKYRDLGETHFYMMEIENDVVIDARYRSNDARFINHSCDPNSMTQKWNVDGLRRIGIFARRRILPGEEITIDYNFSHFGDPIDCKCGSVACTGKIGVKRSDAQLQHTLSKLTASKRTQELLAAPPPEIKRPVQLSSLALLKSAKLDMAWLGLYGFSARRLFLGHRRPTATAKAASGAEASASAAAPAAPKGLSSSTPSSANSPLSSGWSSTTEEDANSTAGDGQHRPRQRNWYKRIQRGEHLQDLQKAQSYICGGRVDWSKELKGLVKTTVVTNPPRRLVTRRLSLLDARARFFRDLVAFANGKSKWNARVPSSSGIDPDRIYRFIDNMKNGQQFLNHNLNDLNEDACHRCKLAGELICCDGCPAAFHLNCTNLAFVPPANEPWFCADCKRNARVRAQVDQANGPAAKAPAAPGGMTSTTAAIGGAGGHNGAETAPDGKSSRKRRRRDVAPAAPSLKRIFHATSAPSQGPTKRRYRKRAKTADRSYRLLEHQPLPSWDEEPED